MNTLMLSPGLEVMIIRESGVQMGDLSGVGYDIRPVVKKKNSYIENKNMLLSFNKTEKR
jgi:hypothetical protein